MSDLSTIKELLDEQGRAFDEFKKKNDERVDRLEKSKGVGEWEQQLARINKEIDEKIAATTSIATKVNDELLKLEVAFKRRETERFEEDAARGSDLPSMLFPFEDRARVLQARALRRMGDDQRKHRDAFEAYARRGDSIDELRGLQTKALSRQNDPKGGYWVPDTMGDVMVRRIFETSAVRQVAGVVSISTDAYTFPNDINDMTATWEGESENSGETTTPDQAVGRIEVHELRARPKATQQLLEDASIDVEGWLSLKAGDRFVRAQNTAYVTGSGVNRPRGFASYTTAATADGSRAWGTLEHVATGTSGGYGTAPNGSDKLIDLIHKIKGPLRAGSVFAMNKSVLGTTRTLKQAANGPYIWMPAVDASSVLASPILASGGSLLGYPVVEMEDLAALGANSLSVAFGNFREGYLIVDRIGFSMLRDPYTAEPFVKFVFRARTGGAVVNFDAIKFLKFI